MSFFYGKVIQKSIRKTKEAVTNMNGSMYQMMKIVSYVKKRIREGTESSIIMPDSNRSIFFEFLEEGFLFAKKK